MRATLRVLLEHLIDYAGMFPPARLPMDQALHHYTRITRTPESWMLGRFVCQAARLNELSALARAGGAPPSLTVAALGRGGRDLQEFRQNLAADLRDINRFRQDCGMGGVVDVIEASLPSALPAAELGQFADAVHSQLGSAGLRAFIEVPLAATWPNDLRTLAGSLVRLNGADTPMIGLKIRCGGAAVPSVEQLAQFIACCREARMPWKATAGLHHPLRHRDPVLGSMSHGFLNVFVAGVLATVHVLDASQVAGILQEEAIRAFRFTEERLGWQDWDCTVAEVRDARCWLPSFGSCSFDEPCDDLRELGLI